MLKYNHCLIDANDDPTHVVACTTNYIGNIKKSNETMKGLFSQEYKEYL